MFQMALLLLKENNCAKSFWNPCINVEVMAWWPFYHLTFKCDLYLQPTWQEEQLCHIIFKSMHKCTSYGPDKLDGCTMHTHAQCIHIHWTEVVTINLLCLAHRKPARQKFRGPAQNLGAKGSWPLLSFSLSLSSIYAVGNAAAYAFAIGNVTTAFPRLSSVSLASR